MSRSTFRYSNHFFRTICVVLIAVECILELNMFRSIAYGGIDFNIHDIMSTQMMPFHIFVYEFNPKISVNYTKDFFPALVTMNYHRKMMQQFMVSDYLSNQILNLKANQLERNINKRIGELNKSDTNNRNIGVNYAPMKMKNNETILFDDGSSRYNAWLKSTTTLDDIQHQLNKATNHLSNFHYPNRREFVIPTAKSILESHGADEDTDSGDITGYAYDGSNLESNYFHTTPLIVPQVPRLLTRTPKFSDKVKEINKSGYDTVFEDYGIHQTSADALNAGVSQPTKQVKEISLKDITDIALTTLAFLSFGMFILQVLMCITMSKEETSNFMMLPMEATESVETNDGTEEIRRRKRSIELIPDRLVWANEVTEALLPTIDILYSGENKNIDMKSHFLALCKIRNQQKIWSILYSLGISWLASRASQDYFSIIKSVGYIFEACT